MHISAQQVDGNIKGMADQEYKNKYDNAGRPAAHHGPHGVNHRTDHACGKAQRQQSGIG